MTTYEKMKDLQGTREQEKFILQNLAMCTGKTVRKNRFNYTAYNKYSKYYFEFDDYDYFMEDNGEQVTIPRYLFVYKEKNGFPVKEIMVQDLIKSWYKTHKILKY